MKRPVATFLGVLSLLAVLAPATLTHAQFSGDEYGGRQQDQARAAVQERRVVPLERIIQEISRRTPGQLLGAGAPIMQNGRMIYRILWDSRGRQIEYIVDAQSGAILSQNGG